MASKAKMTPAGKPKNPAALRGSSVPLRQGLKAKTGSANNRSSSVPPRQPRDSAQPPWLHPDGIRLEDLDETAVMKGAERNAILAIPARYWKRFRRGDRLDQCIINSVHLDTRKLAVTIEDPEAAITANHVPLEEIVEGSYVDGVVVNKSPAGTFVNIGAIKDGRLAVPRSIGIKFVRGQVLRNLLIERVDLQRNWIALKPDNLKQPFSDIEMVGLQLTKGMAKAKTKATTKAKAKTKANPVLAPDMDFMQGDFVDGVVTSIATKGVMVNIGAETNATLVVSAELKSEFQKGDRVQGMKIEKINATSGAITLSMEDPELEVDEMIMLPKPKAKIKAKGKSKTKLLAK